MMGPLSASLSILIYHRVLPEPDPLVPELVCASEFEWQIGVLDRWFRVLPLGEAVARLRAGTLPPRAACVTFDDGYADNATVALPILRRRGVPATFFVATAFLDGGRMFNDGVIETVRRARGETLDGGSAGLGRLPIATLAQRRAAIDRLIGALKYLPVSRRQACVDALAAACGSTLPDDLMMTSDQVRELRAGGMEIGGHTRTHPILAGLEPEQARREIEEGRRRVEAIIGEPVRLFAYPNGKPRQDYRREDVAAVRDLGFDAAVSTAWGVSSPRSDVFQLPRFTPWDRTPGRFLLRLWRNTFRTTPELA
jgi:peptidoglycan/xylan/chitin deacetylase (PgdA/CDA1 family)